MKGLHLTEVEKDEIRLLRKSGLTGKVIARRFAIETGSVYRIEREAPNEEKRQLELAGETAHLTNRKRPLERRLTLEQRDELVLQFTPLARSIAKRIYWRRGRKVEMEDLQQEAFLSLTKHADLHDPDGLPFKAYVRTAVSHDVWQFVGASHLAPKKLKTRLRQDRPAEIVSLDAPVRRGSTQTRLHALRSLNEDSCSAAISADLHSKVEQVYETLPPQQQSAVEMIFQEELTYSAAARKCGCGTQKIKNELLTAMTAFRAVLSVEAEGLVDVTCRSHRSVHDVTHEEWLRVAELMSTDTPRDWIANKVGINRVALFTGFKAWKKAQSVLITYQTQPAALQCA